VERGAKVGPSVDMSLAEGQRAYAFCQADIHLQLRTHCEAVWKDVPNEIGKRPGLPEGPDGHDYCIECH
jgi:hypothetical protein